MTNDKLPHSEQSSSPSSSNRSVTPRSDVSIVRWTADGRLPALGAFYDRWAKHVNSVVHRTTRDTDDAERIVDATFWYAWNTSASFDASHISVSDWLQKIVRRKGRRQQQQGTQ